MFLYIAKSPIHGEGVFTRKQILKGEQFYIVPLKKTCSHAQPRLAKIGAQLWVDDERILNWVNHSCEPNTQLVISTQKPYLEAICDIFPYEEITVNYSETETGGIPMPCSCGSDLCKGYFLVV